MQSATGRAVKTIASIAIVAAVTFVFLQLLPVNSTTVALNRYFEFDFTTGEMRASSTAGPPCGP